MAPVPFASQPCQDVPAETRVSGEGTGRGGEGRGLPERKEFPRVTGMRRERHGVQRGDDRHSWGTTEPMN